MQLNSGYVTGPALLALSLAGGLSCSAPAPAVAPGSAAKSANGGTVHRSELHAFRLDTVAQGLEHPWGIAFLPGGDVLVTERPGRLRIIRGGRLEPQPIEGVPPVYARGQGGLLDVALHPAYASNRWVYLTYSKPGPDGATTALIRGQLEGNRLTNVQELLEAKAWGRGGAHFGSRLAFDRAGMLYMTIGERGEMQRAQDLSQHTGKTLRLYDDGRVPNDNPFVGQNNVLPEIFTWGNRSPQGLTVHPTTGELYQTEHGARGGDELNLLQPGRNYGWPVITWGINYNGQKISDLQEKEGMEQPLYYWVPSIGTAGLAIYNGDQFPHWRGDVFVGGLVGQQVVRLRFDRNKRRTGLEKLLEGYGRIRDVRAAPDGFIYLLIDDPRSAVVRMVPG
jgi:glucose/arabinose dehydrogenase